MDLSLSSALRYRRQQAGRVADQALQKAAQEVIKKNSKVFVHFDTKLIEQDVEGVVQIVERLAILVSSPILEKDQLLCAFPLESGTGEAMAEAIYGTLVSVGLEMHVMGLVADTTATNFGPYNGALVILQQFLGYPVMIIPCLHHVEELPQKHVMRLISGRKTTGPGETIFLRFRENYNEIRPHLTPDLLIKTFNWTDNPIGSVLGDQATQVLDWARRALANNEFDRGDYRYSLQLAVRFFGVLIPGFKFGRPKKVSPARFLQVYENYLEIFMMLNIPFVYELFTGAERDEILRMANFSALYYIQFMVDAKYPAKAPSQTIEAISALRKLKTVDPDIAECALKVRYRHLEPLSQENILFSLADEEVEDEEKEAMGRKILRVQNAWSPGKMVLSPLAIPDLSSERFWREGMVPTLANFVGPRSFLLLDHLHWTKADLEFFSLPYTEWKENEKYQELLAVILQLKVVNDNAERMIKFIKDRIMSVRSENALQDILISVDEMRKRCGSYKANNMNNTKLCKAVRGMLEL